MGVTLPTSSSSATRCLRRALFQSSRRRANPLRLFFFSNGLSSPKSLSTEGRCRRSLVVAGAKKKKNKSDSHSFVPKPDEATGPFPEAVLLKKKTVREDGRFLPEFADAEEEKLYEFLSLQLETNLNVERMRHYEVVYLVHEDRVDDVESVISKVQDFVREKKGRIWRLNNWGLRRLAYKIRKAKNANYILMNFEMEAKWINDFKAMLDKDERVIRHLVIKRDKAHTEDCPPPPEFHTLRAQDDDVEEEDGDDDELEMDGYGGFDDGDNIIMVDDDEEDRVNDVSRAGRLMAEKIAR